MRGDVDLQKKATLNCFPMKSHGLSKESVRGPLVVFLAIDCVTFIIPRQFLHMANFRVTESDGKPSLIIRKVVHADMCNTYMSG